MKRITTILLFLSLLSCGNMGKFQEELASLKSQPPAKSLAGAELAYNKVAELTAEIAKEKEPPQELLDDAFSLQKQRATEWKTVAIKERAVGSAWKVFQALQASGAPVIDFDWSFGDKNNNPEESEVVDPTRDTSGSELLERGKKK